MEVVLVKPKPYARRPGRDRLAAVNSTGFAVAPPSGEHAVLVKVEACTTLITLKPTLRPFWLQRSWSLEGLCLHSTVVQPRSSRNRGFESEGNPVVAHMILV